MKYALLIAAILLLVTGVGNYFSVTDDLIESLKASQPIIKRIEHNIYPHFSISQTLISDSFMMVYLCLNVVSLCLLITALFVRLTRTFLVCCIVCLLVLVALIVVMTQYKGILIVHTESDWGKLKGVFSAPYNLWFYAGISAVIVSSIAIFVKYKDEKSLK